MISYSFFYTIVQEILYRDSSRFFGILRDSSDIYWALWELKRKENLDFQQLLKKIWRKKLMNPINTIQHYICLVVFPGFFGILCEGSTNFESDIEKNGSASKNMK